MVSSVRLDVARLIASQRWAAIATIGDGVPHASMVAYAPEPVPGGLLMLLSGLSAHTQHMLDEPRVSLVIGAPDSGEGDPQQLPRVSLQGKVTEIPRDAEEFAVAATRYVRRFPNADMRLQLADFRLFRFEIDEARYVGGFARAFSLTGDDLHEAMAALPGEN